MKFIFYIFFFISLIANASTPSFVPRTNNTGSIGTSDKQWGTGYFGRVYYGGEDLSNYVSSVKLTSFNAITGSVELVAGDGVQITTNGSQLRISFLENPATSIGTNRVYFRPTGYTNYWTVPNTNITRISVWMWGGGYYLNGGFAFGSFNVTNGQVISVVVGEAGKLATITNTYGTNVYFLTPRSFPNGGLGVSRETSYPTFESMRSTGGGGMSAIYNGTNIWLIAGGGGGFGGSASGNQESRGGLGGGLIGGGGTAEDTTDGSGAGGGATQIAGGSTPNTPAFGLFWTNTAGSYLLGGDGGMTTNVINYDSTGGGGGYYGGGGALVAGARNNFNGQSTGGGGSGYISPFAIGGVTLRGVGGAAINNVATPPVIEIPEYISGAGTDGLIVIGY